MEYVINHIPLNNQKRTKRKTKMKFITIHSTGNPNSNAKGERAYLTNPSNTNLTSYHIVVDENQAIECTPLDEVAYHAGDGRNGLGNRYSIGIEMCETGNRTKVLSNTAKLVARLLNERGMEVHQVMRHFDWNGKNCPRILSADNWQGWKVFLVEIEKELRALKGETIKIEINGNLYLVPGENRNGQNYIKVNNQYIKLRDLTDLFGISPGWKDGTVVINT